MDMRNTDISNILIIGCGGAGLRAAIEAKNNNLSVKILGKRNKNDAHTTLAAGGINAAFGNLDKEDSWLEHFADTYFEGYEIGILCPFFLKMPAQRFLSGVVGLMNFCDNLGFF